jgi:hypothetical protein
MFDITPAHLLEYQLGKGLLSRRPRLFLPLFDCEDADVVLTGIYAYTQAEHFDREDAALIRAALRGALNHLDTRVRCAALETLYRKDWLGVDDARRGLMDEALIIRNLTASFLSNVVRNELAEGAGLAGVRRPAWTAQQRLAPILLDHLNDNYFYVRVTCAHHLLEMFPESNRPGTFDWAKADWQSRVAMQAEWKAWWEGHGKGALVAAAR